MMSIINHGTWSRYTPDPFPAGVPVNLLFCKRDSDGMDWYEYINEGAVFAPGSIKATVHEGIVQAVHRVADYLFPQSCTLIEIIDDDTADPQKKYGGKPYDLKTDTFV